MPHEQGAYLGSVRSVEDLRGRCVCDPHTGCWQLRSARGRVLQQDRTPTIWVYGHGTLSSARAAYLLAKGKLPPQNVIAYRTCESRDCVNPEHIKATPRAVYTRKYMACRAKGLTAAQREALVRGYVKRMVLTPELRVWAIESGQSHGDVAHSVGISPSRVAQVRREAKKKPPLVSSVFAMGSIAMSANDRHAEAVA